MSKQNGARRPRLNPIALTIAAMTGVLSISATAAPGQPTAPAVLVRDVTPSWQQNSAVARDAQGDFIVVWTDENAHAIFGRRFAPDSSPLDGSFRISAAGGANGDNRMPDVAMDRAGNFVVSWLQRTGTGTQAHVVARRYTADGAPAGARFAIEADDSTLTDGAPAIAMDGDGDFVIGWERSNIAFERDGSSGYNLQQIELSNRSVALQRFAANGTPRGAAITAASRPTLILNQTFVVNLLTAFGTFNNFQIGKAVDVAIDDSGDSVVTWGAGFASASYSVVQGVGGSVPLPDATTIYARRYAADGGVRDRLPITVDATVGLSLPDDSSKRSAPKVAMDVAGNFVVAWSENDRARLDGSYSFSVLARRFNTAGKRQGGLLTIDGAIPISNNQPLSIASSASGAFAMAWQRSATAIRTQLFSAAGAPLGNGVDITHSANAFGAIQPAIATDPAGDYVVSWTDGSNYATNDNRIFARTFAGPQ